MALAKQEGVVPMGDVRPAMSDDAPLKDIKAEEPGKVAFMGLGAMGRPMSLGACSWHLHGDELTAVLHNAGLNVVGYDVWDGAREAYAKAGGKVVDNVLDCATGADVLLLIVVNAAQVEDLLFAQGALTGKSGRTARLRGEELLRIDTHGHTLTHSSRTGRFHRRHGHGPLV